MRVPKYSFRRRGINYQTEAHARMEEYWEEYLDETSEMLYEVFHQQILSDSDSVTAEYIIESIAPIFRDMVLGSVMAVGNEWRANLITRGEGINKIELLLDRSGHHEVFDRVAWKFDVIPVDRNEYHRRIDSKLEGIHSMKSALSYSDNDAIKSAASLFRIEFGL